MIKIDYDPYNGLVLPEYKWATWIEGIVTQFHSGCTNIEVSVGCELPILMMQQYIKNRSISHEVVMLYDTVLDTVVPLDNEGDMLIHTTIGRTRLDIAFDMF